MAAAVGGEGNKGTVGECIEEAVASGVRDLAVALIAADGAELGAFDKETGTAAADGTAEDEALTAAVAFLASFSFSQFSKAKLKE